jgi:UDP-3-O-[3-hydroxymyristoyl] glucosamine N-acyltransferase
MIELIKIIHLLKPVQVIGSKNKKIESIRPIDEFMFFTESTLTWLNQKNAPFLSKIETGVIICPESIDKKLINTSCTYLVVQEPRQSFSTLLQHFFSNEDEVLSISEQAKIDKNSSIGSNCSIGHFTVIEKDCRIGNNVRIGSNTTILKGTVIDDNVIIGNNCSIGNIGFGFEKDQDQLYKRIPHIGNVHIAEDVEIGNNVCIDRAVLGSTFIGPNSKIDNLVHIAHGVKIGENTLIIANSMIAGSTKIGDNVWVAPSSSIMNKISIGHNVTIGIGAVVLKSVSDSEVLVGNPAKPIEKRK